MSSDHPLIVVLFDVLHRLSTSLESVSLRVALLEREAITEKKRRQKERQISMDCFEAMLARVERLEEKLSPRRCEDTWLPGEKEEVELPSFSESEEFVVEDVAEFHSWVPTAAVEVIVDKQNESVREKPAPLKKRRDESRTDEEGVPPSTRCEKPYRRKDRGSLCPFTLLQRRLRRHINCCTPRRQFIEETVDALCDFIDDEHHVAYDMFAEELLFAILHDPKRCRLYVDLFLAVKEKMSNGNLLLGALLKTISRNRCDKATLIVNRINRVSCTRTKAILEELKTEYKKVNKQIVANSLILLGELQKHCVICRNVLIFADFYRNHGSPQFAMRSCDRLVRVSREKRWYMDTDYCEEQENYGSHKTKRGQ
ncbi:hypothetical protein QR680_007751 [Steinernema hermaphroditum]|uniref:Uncharacterized protein n=1 Tax=Steinernema hermaphroditum TaxID=289476 RepID=A0AA39M6W5_9BILA|nr:hypothetical protein QR680_007751 [Steinernema hermaphroditum]